MIEIVKLKDIPENERPRERLIRNGVRSLSDCELLAIIIKFGNKKDSVLTLSQRILNKYKTIKNLGSISIQELLMIPGIKIAKATAILAAIELGRRVYLIKDSNYKIKDELDIYKLLSPLVKNYDHEVFYVISLTRKGEVIKTTKVFSGGDSNILLDMKMIFKEPLKLGASAIIIAHNHPSGNASPSQNDIIATNKIIKAARLLEIDLTDHIIIGDGEYYSFFLKDKKKVL